MPGHLLPIALQTGQGGSPILSFVPLILIFGIFYFLVIAPQRKKQKALQETINALKKGDRVITQGGLFAEIVSIHSSSAVVKIADNVKIKISKSAIAGLQGDGDGEAPG